MTLEEALEYFLTDREIHQMWNTAFDIATDALEKQIEKKPIPTMEERDDGTKALAFKCPACNEFLFIGNWCWYCGQALDWSEDDD